MTPVGDRKPGAGQTRCQSKCAGSRHELARRAVVGPSWVLAERHRLGGGNENSCQLAEAHGEVEPNMPLLAQSIIGFEDRGRHQSGTRLPPAKLHGFLGLSGSPVTTIRGPVVVFFSVERDATTGRCCPA